MKNKVIFSKLESSSSAGFLEEKLNAEGADGWQVTHFSSSIRKDNDEYWMGNHFIVLKKTDVAYSYRCVSHENWGGREVSKLNVILEEQNNEGYELIQILHTNVVKVSEYPSNYKGHDFLIFEHRATDEDAVVQSTNGGGK